MVIGRPDRERRMRRCEGVHSVGSDLVGADGRFLLRIRGVRHHVLLDVSASDGVAHTRINRGIINAIGMAAKELTWKIEKRPIAELVPAEYNPRVLSEKAKADLMQSITKFGQVEPLVVNTNGNMIGGHSRIKAFADLGIAEADVMVPSRKLTTAEERELNIRLNKNTGEWDPVKLKEFFKMSELAEYGFGGDELAKWFDKSSETKEDDFDADEDAARNKTPVAAIGDIWQLGNHRLACGDSTDGEVFAALFDGKKADMCFTDPPYNVDYDYTRKYTDGMKQRKGRPSKFAGGTKVFNDDKTDAEFLEMLTKMFLNVYAFSKDSCGIYVCHATKSQEQFFAAFKTAGFHFSQTIIWMKERIILALGQDYHRVYEPIMYGWKKGKKRYSSKNMNTEKEIWNLDKMNFEEQLDIWYLHRDKSKDYVHPTQKPVRLPERAIKKSCPMKGIVVEPFGGSGSTLLACEQLERSCYTIELDPRYCDAIIRRWQRTTGREAECLTRPDAKVPTETP